MIDFLRANPYITKEEYLWEWTIPQIRLATFDFTHIKYHHRTEELKKKPGKINEKKYDNPQDLIRDLNIPVLKKNKNG